MIFRKVTTEDLGAIANLYKICFNLDMRVERYNYWYLKDGEYTSILCEIDGEVVGHNAFIPTLYNYQGKQLEIALSAGGMVNSQAVKQPGLFLKMLQYSIANYEGDAVMAFPNSKAEPFWTRILKFNTIYDNYYSLRPEQLNKDFNEEINFVFERSKAFIDKRTKVHPRYTYETHQVGDITFITKEFNGNIELIYINKINKNLVQAMEMIFEKGFQQINVISIYGESLKKLGFELGKHNVFVYKWLNKEYENIPFECQMIDSDVF